MVCGRLNALFYLQVGSVRLDHQYAPVDDHGGNLSLALNSFQEGCTINATTVTMPVYDLKAACTVSQ